MDASKVTPYSNDDIVQLLIGINKTASLHRTYEISFFNMPELFSLAKNTSDARKTIHKNHLSSHPRLYQFGSSCIKY